MGRIFVPFQKFLMMPDSGVVIKVHAGSDVIYSTSKPVVKSTTNNAQRNADVLVKSLREAKAEINQFLTGLVIKSGDQGQNAGADDASADEEDEDEEDEDITEGVEETYLKGSVNTKRKTENSIDTENSSKIKRAV